MAINASNNFDRLLCTGLAIMITSQALMHMAALIGLMPLTGITLPLVSHGGTSLLMTLLAMGLILQISRAKIEKIK